MSTPETSLFVPLELPDARNFHGKTFPIAFHRPEGSCQLSVEEGVEYIRKISGSGELTRLLQDHGAVVFRGFGHASADTFSKLIIAAEEARGNKPFEQIGLAGKRLTKAPEVFSANEGPRTRRFYQHNEYARYTHFPGFIHFYATVTADEGGESPIANSLEIYERVKEELPEFVQELAKRGLTMRQVYPPAGHNRGNGNYFDWTQEYCFGQKILPGDDEPTRRRKAEEQARRLTPRFKWLDDSSLEVIQDVPAFRRINPGGIPTWFNGLAGQRGSAIDQKAIEPPFIGTDGLHYLRPGYGDGTPIPEKWLDRVVEITRELEYVHTWEAGDLIFVNNHRTTHGRAPWVGERVVLVSMWDALPGTLSEY
ncbi:Clavaminate synthase-like protein [Guyanagaster necrorhizus]|uniref:Clavaminate synthase-like protein n=1 Tax=Guyanagaster necrorhizus TaxID=856835 RepID=A0A9P7W1C8_9AGAR|nr:Clavaminate synthase-like protein [Guyanagaster necrorhizus MCA 3950]KAG7450812.1 Clavaminate synthase-like protein [Guyanagaster necrorhizus MCA 3950]